MSLPRQTSSPGKPRAKRPTLKDVAGHAGVSLSTASLVFSGRGPVSPATADKVRTAAAALSYAGPDPLASSLRHGRAGTVAVVVEGRLTLAFSDPFALSVLDGLATELDTIPAGLLLLARVAGDDKRLLTQLAAAAYDAVAFPLCAPKDDPAVDFLAGRGIPMIGAGAPVDPRILHVEVDERGLSAAMARHVAQLGHSRIGHVTLPMGAAAQARILCPADLDQANYPDARERAYGVLDVAPQARIVEAPDPGVSAGEAAARLLLDAPPDRRPTAIVAQSDLLAAGVIRAAREAGLRVPEDLSVTGVDGLDLPWLDQVLTTVVQDGFAKGRMLGSMIADAMAGRTVRPRPFPIALRIGTTTGPAAAG